MAIKARYTVLDGEILSQTRSGVRHHFVPDPLGSVVALYNTSQSKTDTFTYWPYGEEKSRTGTTTTPFRFVGTLGYYRDAASRSYVRARYYRPDHARWQTEDPVGFDLGEMNLYQYGGNNPTNGIDPTGGQRMREPYPASPCAVIRYGKRRIRMVPCKSSKLIRDCKGTCSCDNKQYIACCVLPGVPEATPGGPVRCICIPHGLGDYNPPSVIYA